MKPIHTPTNHEHVQLRQGRRTGLPIMIAIHSTVLGPAIGGLRIKHYDNSIDGLQDCLRLSEAMTYKAAAINSGSGGGKAVVPLPPGFHLTAVIRQALLLDVAEHIHALNGTYFAGPDIGTGPEDMDFMFRRTPWVGGRSREAGGAGGTTFGTFAGLDSALRAAVATTLERQSMAGLRVSILGLGGIGTLMARQLAAEGAELVVADIDESKRTLAKELGARWLAPEDALTSQCDVLVPCALGGVLTEESVAALECKLICGAANNQLADNSIASLLQARGIAYVPDFIANGGGLMYAVAVELHHRGEAAAEAYTRETIADNVRHVLHVSTEGTMTSQEAALHIGRLRLAQVSGATAEWARTS